jgi:hypothetical protein
MNPTLDLALLKSIATQMIGGTEVNVGRKTMPVGRTSVHRLKTVTFQTGGRVYQAIQQNPDKPSRWGELARAGHHVVQFKDAETNRFVAGAVDGQVKVYGGRGQDSDPRR